MKVRFLDLSVSDSNQREKIMEAIEKVLVHGQVILGPEVVEFENRVAKFCGSPYAVGVNSGTDALFLGLKALGIGPKDEVITSNMSFVASANAIILAGAIPVLSDVLDDFNMDPESVESLITPQTKVIMPVHYAGKMVDMSPICEIAKRYNLHIMEDASQAFSATFQGMSAGTFGSIGCISLNSMKLLAGIGEAGVLLVKNEATRDRLLSLRYNGLVNRKHCHWVSTNGRLDTLQAAILIERLSNVSSLIEKRRQIARYYHEQLHTHVICPIEEEEKRHVYYTYTIRTENRDELKSFLESKNIEAKIYHPVIMDEPAYIGRFKGSGNNARRVFAQKLALPCNEKMSDDEIKYVASSVCEFFSSK